MKMKTIVFGSIPEESTNPQEDHNVVSSQALRKKSEVFFAIASLLTIMFVLFLYGPSAYVKENSVQFTENEYLVLKRDNFVEVKLVKIPHFYGSFEVELKSNQENLIQ